MNETAEIRSQIRRVLEEMIPEKPQRVDGALDRIMEIVNPFRQVAQEEMERFRDTLS